MESENQAVLQQALIHIRRQSSNYSYFTEQALRSGYVEPELGSAQLEHFRDYDYPQHLLIYPHSRPLLPPHLRDIQEAIQIEIEKEQIRNEIIRSEIMRRRALEAEVRRELMIETAFAVRQCHNGPSFDSTVTMGSNLPMMLPLLGARTEKWSVEEMIEPSLSERMRPSGRHETGGYDSQMAQGRTTDLRISEVSRFSEIDNEREKIILQAKHDGNISGSKRKVETPPLKADATESTSHDPLRKKAKTGWTCAICQISATSEQGLNDHMQGKKHKSKEAAMKLQISGKNYCIGLGPKRPTKPIQVANPDSEDGQNLTSVLLPTPKPRDASSKRDGTTKSQERQNPKNLKKNEKASVKKARKNVSKKEKFKFWCDMCQIGVHAEEVMNNHKKGKKHITREQNSKKNDRDEKIVTVHMNKKDVADNGQNINVAKLEDHKRLGENRAEEGARRC